LVSGKTQKGKNIFFFFFPSQNVSYPTAFLQMHWYTYVLRVRAVCYVEGRGIPTLSRMRLSTEQTSFIERYFFTSQNSFSSMTVDARTISFLCQLHDASTVLRKRQIVPSRTMGLFPGNASHAAAASTVYTILVYCCVLIDIQ
jgi:hypothetical protein